MRNKKRLDKIPLKIYKNITDVMTKAYRASNKVMEENRRLGIPTPFSINDKIYHLMPDGRIILRTSRRRAG